MATVREQRKSCRTKIRWAEQLAKIAEDVGEFVELVEVFEQRRKNNPQSIEPLLSIAQAHRIAGNYEERRAALLEATRLKKDDLSLLLEIAKLEESEGDWEKAIETLERASLLDKTNQSQRKIAQLYLQYGLNQSSFGQVVWKLPAAPNSTAKDIEEISVSIAQTGNWEELLDFLVPNVDRFPNNYRLGYLIAIAYEEIGDTETAQNRFLELLHLDQEMLPNNAANKNANPIHAFFSPRIMQQVLPQSASDLQSVLMEIPSYAYSFRHNGAQQSYLGLAGLHLPNDVKSCRQYALCHLLEIARDLPNGQRDGLQKQLERAGVENVNLLMAEGAKAAIRENPMALLELDPDNEAMLAITVLRETNNESQLPQEVYLKAYDTLKDSSPTIGLIAASKLDQTKSENQIRLTDAVKRLETIEVPNIQLVYYIALRRDQSSQTDTEDPLQHHRATLNKLLSDWYPKITTSPQMSSWVFEVVVGSFHKEKSPEQLIRFLDQEVVRSQGQKNQQPAYRNLSRLYARNFLRDVALPEYPPSQLISFPTKIYDQLQMPSPANSDELFIIEGEEKIEIWSQDKTLVAVSTAKNPTLKALLQLKYFHARDQKNRAKAEPLPDSIKAAFGENVTDSKSVIDELLNKSKTNVDAWYLAGALAASELRWDDAATAFETIRNLPMTAKARRKIDGHLVALATLGLNHYRNNKANEKVLVAAKSAALRMRRGILSQEQREELLAVFQKLRLNDEAKEMMNQIDRAANTRGSAPARQYTSVDKIEKLNRAGKTDAVARLLMQEFQKLARQRLTFGSINTGRFELGRFELSRFKRKVEKLRRVKNHVELGLEDKLLKMLDPGETTNARKLGTWAIAQEVFGTEDVAESTYKKVTGSSPPGKCCSFSVPVFRFRQN